MRRKGRFLAGFAAAVITFGTLWATLGPEKFNQHRCSPCHRMEQCHQAPSHAGVDSLK